MVAGLGPGVRIRRTAGRSRRAISSWRRGTNPARSSEDLPLPDAPNRMANRWPRTSSYTSPTSRSRPKNSCRWAGSNRARPRYGAAMCPSSGAHARAASASFHRASHSPGSPPHART